MENAVEGAANNDSVANIILSLKGISEQNWSDFFESVSCLEKTLREDPAGIYPRMDFKTRDLYRKEIETLSFATGRDENELAEITLDLARSALSNHPDELQKSAAAGSTVVKHTSPAREECAGSQDNPVLMCNVTHVGEYLLGESRPVLEKRIG